MSIFVSAQGRRNFDDQMWNLKKRHFERCELSAQRYFIHHFSTHCADVMVAFHVHTSFFQDAMIQNTHSYHDWKYVSYSCTIDHRRVAQLRVARFKIEHWDWNMSQIMTPSTDRFAKFQSRCKRNTLKQDKRKQNRGNTYLRVQFAV